VDRDRLSELMKVVDKINSDWGDGALVFAQSGVRKNWTMKREKKSPHFTTNWNQLPFARC